jgi:hypothetical protein
VARGLKEQRIAAKSRMNGRCSLACGVPALSFSELAGSIYGREEKIHNLPV